MIDNVKLPQDIKDKWITALRSGEYKQATGILYDRTKDSYCCLGVLGKICGYTENILQNYRALERHAFENTPNVCRGHASDNNVVSRLTRMNDIEQLNFIEISDYIEQNL